MKFKKKSFCILVVLTIISGLTSYFIIKDKAEGLALRLQLKLLSSSKKKSQAWVRASESKSLESRYESLLKPTEKGSFSGKLKDSSDDSVPRTIQIESIEDVAYQSTDFLVNFLDEFLNGVQDQDLKNINKAILIADELISRNPNSFSTYKAKLILLITAEAKNFREIDEEEFERLLEEMASFDMKSDPVLRKEAFLIAGNQSKLEELYDSIENMQAELTEIDFLIDLENGNEDSDVKLELTVQLEALEEEIENKLDIISEIENEFSNELLEESDYFIDDIVQIPLQRWLAKGQYQVVIEESEALLAEFPDSVTDYFYVAAGRAPRL